MDADSCPVKEEIVEISRNFDVPVIFVASYNHVPNDPNSGTWHFVDSDKEAADLFIMNHTNAYDIAVTQDIGLASTLLAKKVYVLNPRGSLYEEKDIESALHMRFLSAKMRRQGKHSKGPKPFTMEDRIFFKENFIKVLSKIKGVL